MRYVLFFYIGFLGGCFDGPRLKTTSDVLIIDAVQGKPDMTIREEEDASLSSRCKQGAYCKEHGFDGGVLGCKSPTEYDFSQCYKCGDQRRDSNEECDGLDFGPHTCQTQGYDDGQLKCLSTCHVDATDCQSLMRLDVDTTYSCAVLDHRIKCWGKADFLSDVSKEALFSEISIGKYHLCALTLEGEIRCWGSNQHGQSEPPKGRFTNLVSTIFLSCALDGNSRIRCWGKDVGRRAPSSTFSQIEIRRDRDVAYACGIRMDGRIECWGRYPFTEAPPSGQYISVHTGHDELCGLGMDGVITCIGINLDHKFEHQHTQKYKQLSMGFDHACGVLLNDKAHCWGWEKYGRTLPPNDDFVEVKAANFHTCGRLRNGDISCWGRNESGQSNP